MGAPLPAFVPPMLATLGRPFDSDDHLFEVKWDGTRALAFVEGGAYRLRNRRDRDMVPRYPELSFLSSLPDGTVLDGEIVVLVDGKPDFSGMLRREQATGARRAAALAAELPASYVVFDLLYEDFEPVMPRPLEERREHLERIVRAAGRPRLVLSEGVVGGGRAMFEQACALELEGLVAKRLQSPYLPGRRSDAWVKMKRVQRLHCAIIGFVPEGDDDLKSLVLAAPGEDGALRCVGKVGSGLTAAQRRELAVLLRGRLSDRPLVATDLQGLWVEPGIYCTVSFLEWTRTGTLRAPVFQGLVHE